MITKTTTLNCICNKCLHQWPARPPRNTTTNPPAYCPNKKCRTATWNTPPHPTPEQLRQNEVPQ